MPNYLRVPPELQHLIEKRESDDRRQAERRSGEDRRAQDLGPSAAVEPVGDPNGPPDADRRSGEDRRGGEDRRDGVRRQSDVAPRLPDLPVQGTPTGSQRPDPSGPDSAEQLPAE